MVSTLGKHIAERSNFRLLSSLESKLVITGLRLETRRST